MDPSYSFADYTCKRNGLYNVPKNFVLWGLFSSKEALIFCCNLFSRTNKYCWIRIITLSIFKYYPLEFLNFFPKTPWCQFIMFKTRKGSHEPDHLTSLSASLLHSDKKKKKELQHRFTSASKTTLQYKCPVSLTDWGQRWWSDWWSELFGCFDHLLNCLFFF